MYKIFVFYVFKTCTTHAEVAAWRHFVRRLLLKHYLIGIKADYISTDKHFHSIFREIFENIKPSF